EAVHGARCAHDLLALEPAGAAGVPLERQGVGSEAHDKGAALSGESRRGGRDDTSDEQAGRGAGHELVSRLGHVTRIDLTSSFCAILLTTSMPLVTCPKTVWTPSRWRCGEWQMKNWLPPVSLDRKSTRLNSSHVSISY